MGGQPQHPVTTPLGTPLASAAPGTEVFLAFDEGDVVVLRDDDDDGPSGEQGGPDDPGGRDAGA